MRVVTVRDFRDRATEMFRSEDVILITREGVPAGFFVPWSVPDLPDDLRREVFAQLTERIKREMDAKGVTEQDVADDFSALRARRRR